MANAPVELLVVPLLLILGWREGTRRILIVAAAALYFLHRVWTYLASHPTGWISLKRRWRSTPAAEAAVAAELMAARRDGRSLTPVSRCGSSTSVDFQPPGARGMKANVQARSG
jgi:peptidoglycan/LPS O-acetylase OafA/YrhL